MRHQFAAGMDRRGARFFDVLPQWRPYPGRYGVRALRALDELQRSGQYLYRLHVFPSHAERAFDAGESKEEQASMPAGAFVVGFTGHSTQAAGFRVTLWDNSGRSITGNSVQDAALCGKPGANRGAIALVDGLTWGFPQNGQIIGRITNLHTAAADIQFVLWTAERVQGHGGRAGVN